MKILVLGATGMLGHKLMQVLSTRFDVVGMVRGDAARFADHLVLGDFHLLGEGQVEPFDTLIRMFGEVQPEAVINCIGIIKQLKAAHDPLPSLTINALFPHRLAQLCRATGCRLIHISTDCVFSGRKGNYTEEDISDAEDLYGRSKFLGEVSGPGCLTLRTSIIGRELRTSYGLLEWFLRQRGKTVNGFAKAIYTGFTTEALAALIGDLLQNHPHLDGLWQVSSAPISKYDLLGRINEAFRLGITINRDESFCCDRSLDSTRFRQATGYTPPSWEEMIAALVDDPTPYASMHTYVSTL